MRIIERALVLALLIFAYSVGLEAQTWTRLAVTGSPLADSGASVVYDHASNILILFGGVISSTPCCTNFNDVWVLTNANGLGGPSVWTKLTPATPNGAPAPRSFQSAVYDSVHNIMTVFGGGYACCGAFVPLYNDVWVLTDANGIGTPTWTPLSPLGTPPAAREGHTAIYDSANNRMIVFGGGDNGIMNVPNDLWVLKDANSLGTPEWIQLSPTGQAPPPVERFAPAYDAASNRLTIFGGCCYWNNSTWLLTNANGVSGTPVWAPVSPSGTPPQIREVHAYGYDPSLNELIIFGFGAAGVSYNDTWVLSSANSIGGTPTWTNPIPNNEPSSPPFPFLAADPGVYDPFTARLMLEKAEDNGQGGIAVVPWVLSLKSPLLTFPVKQDSQCIGSGSACTPANAPINSVFDHSMAKPYECQAKKGGYGTITAFTAESGSTKYAGQGYGACGKLYGYTNSNVSSFLKGYNYTGVGVLWYDSHPGIDYNFAFGTPLYPSVNGCVTYLKGAAGVANPATGHVLAINPQPTEPKGGCKKARKSAAYSVVYMHLSSYYDKDQQQVMRCTDANQCSSGQAIVECPTCARQDDWVSTDRSDPIGYTGDFFITKKHPDGWGGVGPHLHFEVDQLGGDRPAALDPYGWCGTPASDPYTKLTGLVNSTLWSNFTLTCP